MARKRSVKPDRSRSPKKAFTRLYKFEQGAQRAAFRARARGRSAKISKTNGRFRVRFGPKR